MLYAARNSTGSSYAAEVNDNRRGEACVRCIFIYIPFLSHRIMHHLVYSCCSSRTSRWAGPALKQLRGNREKATAAAVPSQLSILGLKRRKLKEKNLKKAVATLWKICSSVSRPQPHGGLLQDKRLLFLLITAFNGNNTGLWLKGQEKTRKGSKRVQLYSLLSTGALEKPHRLNIDRRLLLISLSFRSYTLIIIKK